MKRESFLIEVWRKELYQWLPVPKEWHEDYTQGKVSFADYRDKGLEVLIRNKKIIG